MKWSDVPRFPRASYEIDVEWGALESQIEFSRELGLDLEPDYQRVHVWTEEQRRAYIEYSVQGGEVGRTLTFVCTDWQALPVPGYSLLDGKQRLQSVRMFLRSELAIFPGMHGRPDGWRFQEIIGPARMIQGRFQWRVVQCRTRVDVLRLYLAINAGGTPHTPSELDRVRQMVEEESCSRPSS